MRRGGVRHPNALALHHVSPMLAEGLDDDGVGALETWLRELQAQDSPPAQTIAAIRAVLQHRSLHRSIIEAFA